MSSTDALLDTAFHAYNTGRFDEAEALAREVLSVTPAHGDAVYLLGLIAFQAGALEPAAELLYQAAKLYPDIENYALALASLLHKQGRLDEALSFYEKYKENALALSQIGLIYVAKGQDDWAASAFEEALHKKPDLVEAIVGLALIARRQGKMDEAESLLKRAEIINPTTDVLYQLAMLYRLQEDFKAALTVIERTLMIHKTPLILNEYGLILQGLGQEEQALQAYRDSIELNPYFADGYFNQGNVYQKQGHFALAEDAYKRALNQDKKFLQAHHNLASILYKQGRITESLDHLQEAIIIDSRHVPAIYNLGVIMEERGEFSEAAGLYFNALSLGMKDAVLPFRIHATILGLARQNAESKKQAIQFAKGWVKNFPDDVVACHTLAIVSGHKSDFAQKYATLFYDVFASSYDDKMQQLDSHALDEMLKIIPSKKYKNILDLACGTGTFASKINKGFKSISGVDISQKMLDLAHNTGLYDELICTPVTTFLSHTKSTFNLIVAVELVCYLDDVEPLFKGVQRCLTKDGLFACTVEISPTKKESTLSLNGRYLYSQSFIEKQLVCADLQVLKIQDIDLRREGDSYAKGFALLAKISH